jgi:ATP-dependent exoDNAse (exonuclease V) beta subunit
VTERERPNERVPLSARHVCLLFRRFDSFFAGDVTRGYVQALEARGVRHLLVGGRSFHDREEVETIRTALTAIEWPDDELAVFATLRGPVFAVGDEELLEYRHRFRRLHPFRVPREELPERLWPIATALGALAGLHRERNRRPIAETINLLLETTRAHAGFALRPSGEQVLANVLHVAEQARAYEGSGGISFRGFVQRLMEDADGRRTEMAPILEEGSEGVRIMTVHKAKGLEFPVVILADMTADIALARPNRWIDPSRRLCAMKIAGWSPAELLEHREEEVRRDVAEGVRLAYVAATRARDLLVVPAIGDAVWRGADAGGANAGWLSPLNDAIYPPKERWGRAEEAPGCPPFGGEAVLERPHDPGFRFDSVTPGLHEFPERGYGVVWWDPGALELEVPPLFGVRQEELMAKDADRALVEADVRRHRDWQEARSEALAHAGEPGLELRTAREHAARLDREKAPPPGVEVVELAREVDRPTGPRFGALVHAVLATVDLEADPAGVRAVARLQARVLGAPDEEAAAAESAVIAALRHPVLERARRAAAEGECRREAPVTLREADGTLVDGVVDLAFPENERWIVVDFKTDAELERELPVYRQQVGLYARMVAAATGREANAVLVRV